MRLIDADALRWAIRENAPKSVPLWVYQTIDKQPIAYKMDEVIRQIERLRDNGYVSGITNNLYELGAVGALDKAIEIVKAGEINK